MTRFLLDEMYPPAAADVLRDEYGHDAVHVSTVGLAGAEDREVAHLGRGESRVVVTENVADYAQERDVVLAFVLKKRLPAGQAQAPALANILNRWSRANPDPYIGPHWPA